MVKLRIDFVTNSSEVCYVIHNSSSQVKTAVDFIKAVFDMFDRMGRPDADDWISFNREEYLEEAEEMNLRWNPRGSREFFYNWETDSPFENLLLQLFGSYRHLREVRGFSFSEKML